jgi:DMSO/TMAO reductase YedYZ molybdopterin-dependent catalytic subunit
MRRRLFLATGGAVALAGCARISNALTDNPAVHNVLASAESLNHALIGTHGLAKTYRDSDVDRDFRVNGFDTPSSAAYGGLARGHFAGYKLIVDGAVDNKQALSLDALRALASLTQITRHDCVEGWSAIGKWGGVQLATVLALAKPTSAARYVIFHCFDRSSDGDPYYESLDLAQAAHPQAILALALNDRPLDLDHGAPVRVRVPTQLGYKSAKWVSRIEVATTLGSTFGGKGGYWEDNGYEWYAGI